MAHADLSRAPWHGLEELMDSMPETIFRKFIKVPTLGGRAYQPGETAVKLPKSFRQLGSCEECGRLWHFFSKPVLMPGPAG